MEELLTCEEAAARLGIHVGTIRSWIREGHIPAYRLGQRFTRVRWDEVLDALSETGGGEQRQEGPAR
jgi:excisionase family DNA binding protein